MGGRLEPGGRRGNIVRKGHRGDRRLALAPDPGGRMAAGTPRFLRGKRRGQRGRGVMALPVRKEGTG